MTTRPVLTLLSLLVAFVGVTTRAAENPDEIAVKAVIERFLTELGDANDGALPALFASKASIAWASLKAGRWTAGATSFEEWHAGLKIRANRTKFREPVDKWQVQVDDGQLAFVRAETHIEREDRITLRNIDYFTLLKMGGVWKITHGSYTAKAAN